MSSMSNHQQTIDVATSTVAALASKAAFLSAFFTVVLSWLDQSPPGVIAGIAIAILTFLVNVGFRALADHRDRKHRAMEAELRRLPHLRRRGQHSRAEHQFPCADAHHAVDHAGRQHFQR